jgi:hypothetical protein
LGPFSKLFWQVRCLLLALCDFRRSAISCRQLKGQPTCRRRSGIDAIDPTRTLRALASSKLVPDSCNCRAKNSTNTYGWFNNCNV